MSNIVVTFGDGTQQKTPYMRGSHHEYKFHTVMICCGSIHDSPKKYYFASEKAYKEWCGETADMIPRDVIPRDVPMRVIGGMYTASQSQPQALMVQEEDDGDEEDDCVRV